jgi:hypothetical protein
LLLRLTLLLLFIALAHTVLVLLLIVSRQTDRREAEQDGRQGRKGYVFADLHLGGLLIPRVTAPAPFSA